MKKRHIGTAVLFAALTANGLLLTGCTNSDYDFNQIDKTMGFGGDLTLPASSTMQIPLKDILELKDNGCILIDEEDSTYNFYKEGETTSSAHPYIEKITITKSQAVSKDITLTLAAATRAADNAALKGEGDVFTFKYSGSKPSSVVALSHADIDCTMDLQTNLYGISPLTESLDKVVLTFPEYMEIECTQGTVDGNVITLQNVPTRSGLDLSVKIKGLDFTKTNSGLAVTDQSITMDGTVHMLVQASTYDQSATVTSATITNSLTMSNVTVESATGKFNPSIELNNLGNVSITGIPDFLSGPTVKIDLDNPRIVMSIESDMPARGFLDGTINSLRYNSVIATAKFTDLEIHDSETAQGQTNAFICRRAPEGPYEPDVVVKEVPELSKLVERIPDYLTFSATTRMDDTKETTFQLGKQYNVEASYYVSAPLAFAENAVIEYQDSFSGWQKDLKDIQLAEGTYISLTATAQNKLPLALNVEVTPVDVDGGSIIDLMDISIKQGKVPASADGKTAAEAPLEIEIRESTPGALKKLDGLSYTFQGKATQDGVSVTGVTLNAKDHTLKLNDIKVKIVGQVVADLN